MKKSLLLFFTILVFGSAFSQVKLGLNFNPGILINRVEDPKIAGDTLTYDNKGAGLKFSAGPDLHIMFGDNWGMTLGLWYAARRAGVTVEDIKNNTKREDVYNVQYVQMPVTLRMYTNEVATGMQVYFMVGGTVDVKLKEKDKKIQIVNDPVLTKISPIDASILAGAGVQFELGSETFLLAGLRYQRGLIDNAWKYDNDYNGVQKFKLNTDFISLDLGIKF